jgi:hypothetical protein
VKRGWTISASGRLLPIAENARSNSAGPRRFPSVQDFVSYCRLVKCGKEPDGKHYGYSGAKIGNAHLKWAFSEAAVLCLRQNPAAQRFVAHLTQHHGKGKALTIFAHKLARAVYCMLRREQVFDASRFFAGTAAVCRPQRLTPRSEIKSAHGSPHRTWSPPPPAGPIHLLPPTDRFLLLTSGGLISVGQLSLNDLVRPKQE